jgi:predicted hotdog family 3-hydroxylacyl-ACP dehydratase
MHPAEFPVLEQVMPHRGDALLLERVLEHDGHHTVALVDVDSQRWLKREDGSVASWLVVEYMAQCIAAHAALLAHAEHRRAPNGFLIRVRGLRLHAPEIPAGTRLRVSARPVLGRPGLGVVSQDCRVHQAEDGAAGALVAEGRLTLAVHSAPPNGGAPAD